MENSLIDTTEGEQQLHILDLPDNAVLAVMAYLSPKELFTCRVVCRYFQDICLHKDLWSKISVWEPYLLRSILKRAPCLSELSVATDIPGLLDLLSGSNCRIYKLELYALDNTIAKAVIETISSLGCLKELELYTYTQQSGNDLAVAILNIPLLLKLTFAGEGLPLVPVFNWKPKTAFLKEFHFFEETKAAGQFLEFILQAHAASIEVLQLWRQDDLPIVLLKNLPKLRSLETFTDVNLEMLWPLPNLESVGIHEKTGMALLKSTEIFLRKALHLKRVKLFFNSPGLTSVVLALSKSQSAQTLECIELHGVASKDLHFDETFCGVILQFSSLQTLYWDKAPSQAFFESVTTASMPHLLRITIAPRQPCLHAWLHENQIQSFLARNPRLHLCFYPSLFVSGSCFCKWCISGCHTFLVKGGNFAGALAAHEKKTGLPETLCKILKVLIYLS